MTSDLDRVFARLAKSVFRKRFRLAAPEQDYLQTKGLETVLIHARDIVAHRLAPVAPLKDGKQTPFRGHPVFVAQHATATCCRGCLAKWHGIPAGGGLTAEEQDYIAAVVERWLTGAGKR